MGTNTKVVESILQMLKQSIEVTYDDLKHKGDEGSAEVFYACAKSILEACNTVYKANHNGLQAAIQAEVFNDLVIILYAMMANGHYEESKQTARNALYSLNTSLM